MAIIVKPLVTEKMNNLAETQKKYGFIVNPKANKIEIKAEIESLYNVTVVGISTMRYAGKAKNRNTRAGFIKGRTNAFKKAIVTLKDGDVIDLEFEDKIEFIQNAGGVSLKKGPLLYALPIREEKIILGLRDRNNEDFPHYALYPGSKWNYGMPSVREIDPIFRSTASVQEEPWRAGNSGLSIDVVVHGIPAWKLRKVNAFLTRKTPRGKGTIVHKKALFTPRVRNFSLSQTEKEEIVKLVPYATTRLRISIFPAIE